MLYLYAITDVGNLSAPLPPGVGDIVPELLPISGISVVAAQLREKPVCDAAAARRHMEVLAALMQHGTVLPVRFGTTFETRDELDIAVAETCEVALADLRRLRGCVELGLRVTAHEAQTIGTDASPELPDGGPGARYLAAKRMQASERLKRERINEALAARICSENSPLATLAVETAWRSLPQPAGHGPTHKPAISVSFLVPAERVDRFSAALTCLRSTEPRVEFFCTGPWPPFSFVSAGQAHLTRTCNGKVATNV